MSQIEKAFIKKKNDSDDDESEDEKDSEEVLLRDENEKMKVIYIFLLFVCSRDELTMDNHYYCENQYLAINC